jgi:hypothetical protein
VILRLLELSDQTTIYCVLVKLLYEQCNQEASYTSSKYLELVMKCIWRQIRRLSENGKSKGNGVQHTKKVNSYTKNITK